MVEQAKRILIVAGGTGGHIFPALAVARELMERGAEVRWLGAPDSMEQKLVPGHDIEIDLVNMKGVRGKGRLQILKAPFMVVGALLQTLRHFHNWKPDCVLGMGGYVTAPAGLAAKIMGIPLLIHEQNAVAGLSNKLLSRIACRILEGFEGTFQNNRKCMCTGNPVREEITNLEHLPKEDILRVLIVGGSLGALAINQVVPVALSQSGLMGQVNVWHQAGERHLEVTRKLYQENAIEARVDSFIDDMAEAYRWADLVVCRSGALTIAELACAQLPAVLVPYPFAVDDHQTENARHLVDRGAAVLMPQTELTAERLADLLKNLVMNRELLSDMSAAAKTVAMPDATKLVVHQCLEVAYA